MPSIGSPAQKVAISGETLPCGEEYGTSDPQLGVGLGAMNNDGGFSARVGFPSIYEYPVNLNGICRASVGDVVDGDTITNVSSQHAAINDHRDIAFTAEVAGGEWLILNRGSGAPAVAVAKNGDPIPGELFGFGGFGWEPDLNNNGDIVFTGTDGSQAWPLWLCFYSGQTSEISVLLRSGDPVPGLAPRTFRRFAPISYFNLTGAPVEGLEVNDNGDVVFSAQLDNDAYGIFRLRVETLSDCRDEDVNCDGNVTGVDMAVVVHSANWMQTPPACDRADVNDDGSATGGDLARIVSPGVWLTATGPCICTTSTPGVAGCPQ